MAAEPGRLDSEDAPGPESPHVPGSPAGQDASLSAAQNPGQDGGHHQAAEQEPAETEDGPATKGRAKRPFWRELAVIVVAALVLTILLKAFVVQVFSIPSGSMENTLMPGDRVLVNKLVYRFRPIERGDVVVFSGTGSWDPASPPGPGNPLVRLWDGATNLVGISAPGTDYIKRVIGVPGDHVACCDAAGRVTVNGVALDEVTYVHPGEVPSQQRFKITVPPGRLWVMGDNRADSDDSRYRTDDPGGGTIPESAVVGRAFVIIWPTSRWGTLPIPSTFSQPALHAAALVTSAPAVAAIPLVTGFLAYRRRRNRNTTNRH
jgi:signal peptidase I